MSHVELLDAAGPWWSPILAALLIGLYLICIYGACRLASLIYAAHRRGLARVRRAQHPHRPHLRSVR